MFVVGSTIRTLFSNTKMSEIHMFLKHKIYKKSEMQKVSQIQHGAIDWKPSMSKCHQAYMFRSMESVPPPLHLRTPRESFF